MLKRLNNVLNIVMGSSVGVCIGHGIYSYWHFKKYPGLYELQSAPWYTSLIIYGAVTFGVIVICTIVKIIIQKKLKQ